MPGIPPPSASILDSVTTVLNSARHRLNDRLPSLLASGGKVLETEDAFSQQCTNDAWRWLQENLADLGYTPLKNEAIITGLPAITNQDPAAQQFISWNSFFDGTNYQSAPVLPSNLVHPLKVWERWTNQNQYFPKDPMDCYLDGMPSQSKTVLYNGFWEWRNAAIYLPGSAMSMDLRVLYVQYLPDFVTSGITRWYQQTIPLARCIEPFSWRIVFEFSNSRAPANDAEAAEQAAAASEAQNHLALDSLKLLFNRDVKMKQRVTVSRQPRSGRGGGNGYFGGGYGGY
jgi:hypothetical protein